jgi:UDP-N-acetylglucosamine 2-epimerase
MKIATVVGARPQFVKAAAMARAIDEKRRSGHDIEEVIIHTGQHYDQRMSASFFADLGIAEPRHNLAIGSDSHGRQTGRMMSALEEIVDFESPEVMIVHGDTNSTLAGALVAAKRNLSLVHVEAGLRSFDRTMPEEVNRVLTDHVSDLLCCPSNTAIENLRAEGIVNGVHLVGDVMYDVLLADIGRLGSDMPNTGSLPTGSPYILATIHRASTTDDSVRFTDVVRALSEISSTIAPVVWPVHPRTSGLVKVLALPDSVHLIDPVSYHEMLVLIRQAETVVTDSGGLQKEAFWLQTPCVTVRESTEWPETIQSGWNQLVGTSTEKIIEATGGATTPTRHPPLYGDGHSAEHIVELIEALNA